jgi:glycosyltransferase involved in cell wall biosynthesis
MTTVAIAITAFSCGDFLASAIASVLSQYDQDWRCAVIYDPAEHECVVSVVSEAESRIISVPSPRMDVCRARNVAFTAVPGELMIALDGDDLLLPDYVSTLRAAMARADVRIAYSGTQYLGLELGRKIEVPYSRRTLAIRNMIVSAAMFRRSDFERVQGYDSHPDNHYEDWDLWISILKHGGEVAFIDAPLFMYRQRVGSRWRSVTHAQNQAGREYIFSKHSDFCWHTPEFSALRGQKPEW